MYKHILVPLDGSKLAECVLPHVVVLAQALTARIFLLRVLECQHATPSEENFVDVFQWMAGKTEARYYLEQVAESLRALDLSVESGLAEGNAAEQIVDHAQRQNADLIVLSSHGQHGLSRWNVSSVVQKVLLGSHRSILLVRAYLPVSRELSGRHYERILVPLDGSLRAEYALPVAVHLARASSARLILGHVVQRPAIPRRLPPTPEDLELAEQLVTRNRTDIDGYFQELQRQLPLDVEVCLLVGDEPAAALHTLVEQKEADLVVLCAHGYSGSNRWPFGSVAANLILYGSTPLLIVQDLAPSDVMPGQAEMATREQFEWLPHLYEFVYHA